MLKVIRGLILVLAVLVGSACVTPTHASSASLVIVEVQAGGATGGALDELVVIYNNSESDVDITNWCVANKTGESLGCFEPDGPTDSVWLPKHTYVLVESQNFYNTTGTRASIIYEQTNGSSGKIVASNDTINIIDDKGEVIDSVSWTTAVPAGKLWQRLTYSAAPARYYDTDTAADWLLETTLFTPQGWVVHQPVEEATLLPPIITELLPNAAGSDVGQEFIELYNPNNVPITLDGIDLLVGQTLEKTINFPTGTTIEALAYRAFSNSELSFSLVNSTSRVALQQGANMVSEAPAYSNPKDGMAWALIDTAWVYTNQPTPNAINISSLVEEKTQPEPEVEEEGAKPASVSTLKPCAANQYRSPETNRCRLIEAAASEPAACKEGQERNPETNRCRNVPTMTEADYAVLGATEQPQTSSNWYVWAAVSGVVLLGLGYAVWEWRSELKKLFQFIKGKFRKLNK